MDSISDNLTPCMGIRILESVKFLPVDSEILGFGFRNSAQRIQNLNNDWNPESSNWYLEFLAWNPESLTVLDCLSWVKITTSTSPSDDLRVRYFKSRPRKTCVSSVCDKRKLQTWRLAVRRGKHTMWNALTDPLSLTFKGRLFQRHLLDLGRGLANLWTSGIDNFLSR